MGIEDIHRLESGLLEFPEDLIAALLDKRFVFDFLRRLLDDGQTTGGLEDTAHLAQPGQSIGPDVAGIDGADFIEGGDLKRKRVRQRPVRA